MIVSVICRSPSRNNNEYEVFLSNLEKILSKINKCKSSVSVIAGDFNARSFYWWCKDTKTTEGSTLYLPTSSKHTHIQENNSSCIDLTDQPNLLINSGVHS